MSVSEDDLRRAVDDVLEPAWPQEHQRARRRWIASTLGRIAIGILGFYGMAFMLFILFGFAFPWTFYVFVGGMTTAAGLSEARDPDHLRKDAPPPGGDPPAAGEP